MNFCNDCGSPLNYTIRPEKTRPVLFCPQCRQAVQQHPKLLVATFISCGNKLLWMRRAHDPQKGHWAIPAGFMEQGETLQQASARELFEETGVSIDPNNLQLYMMGTISFISEVYIAFHGEVSCEDCAAGVEAMDVQFFSREQLPWDQVAYPEANNSIIQAYDDLERGRLGIYHAEMTADKNDLLPINTHTAR